MKRALHGKTVLITRSESDADPLYLRLQHLGADVVLVPSVTIVPIAPLVVSQGAGAADIATVSLRDLMERAGWLACVSRHGAHYFASALQSAGLGVPATVRLAAVGPGTADVMTALWRAPAVVAEPPTGEGMAACLVRTARPDDGWVVLPRGQRGRRVVRDALAAAGFTPVEVLVYDTRVATSAEGPLTLPPRVDYVLFTSPSTVEGYLARASLPPGAAVITIGPTTTAAAQARGLTVSRQATEPSLDGLVAALTEMD